jgi:hypothetical protein
MIVVRQLAVKTWISSLFLRVCLYHATMTPLIANESDNPDAMERIKLMEIDSTPSEKTCMVYFEIVEVTENFLGSDDIRINRYIGRRIVLDYTQIRVDYIEKTLGRNGEVSRAAHSLYHSPKEHWCAGGFVGNSIVLEMKEGETCPINMPFLSPWPTILLGEYAVLTRAKRDVFGGFIRNFTPIEYGAGELFATSKKYLVSKVPKTFVNEFVYDHDDPSKLERFVTYKIKSNPRQAMTFDEISAAKEKDWLPIRDCKITWIDVVDYGRQPHIIFTRSQSTFANHPEHKTDIEIRFFGYEFDKAKIPTQMLDKLSFNTASINRDFKVSEIELMLEQDKKLVPTKK